MDLGVIVTYGGHHWRVYKRDGHVRTVTLMRWGGHLEEIADDDPGAVVVANPRDWPVVTARVKPTAGLLVGLTLARGGRGRPLTPLVEWVPSDMGRPGGSIFISPALGLKIGEVLVAQYERGAGSRIVITKRYGTMAQRKIPEPPKKRGLMDYLDGDDIVE